MSVDYQDEIVESWDATAATPDTDPLADGAKYATLNMALEEAGSVLGDIGERLPIAFRFDWHDMTIFCEIAERDAVVMLQLDTDLGPLPFTVEDRLRRGYLKELRDTKVELHFGEFVVTKRHRFRHRVSAVLPTPINGSHIVTAVVQSLLRARPYYELAKAQP